jgi:hypothetical protein
MRAMLLAIVILVLAWGLGGVTEALGTGATCRACSAIRCRCFLPVLVFLVAAAISFATGTSWGTMAILFPVVIPLAVAMGAGVGFDGGEHYTILLGTISSIMAGSIFGDHCSPISDTTVLSSMASACDHIDHVRTQLPYALPDHAAVVDHDRTDRDLSASRGLAGFLECQRHPSGIVGMGLPRNVKGPRTWCVRGPLVRRASLSRQPAAASGRRSAGRVPRRARAR